PGAGGGAIGGLSFAPPGGARALPSPWQGCAAGLQCPRDPGEGSLPDAHTQRHGGCLMLPRTTHCGRDRRRLLILGAAVAAALLGGPARAADLKKDTSLSLIPADAAFFSSNLRNKEQIDLVLASKAYKKLAALPAV